MSLKVPLAQADVFAVGITSGITSGILPLEVVLTLQLFSLLLQIQFLEGQQDPVGALSELFPRLSRPAKVSLVEELAGKEGP